MKEKHIFIRKAFIYKKSNISLVKEVNEGYEYDALLGYWVNKNNRKPAIYDPHFSGPITKKEDIETGEDQKGE